MKKAYCVNCYYYRWECENAVHLCGSNPAHKDTPYERVPLYEKCEEKNAGNDCAEFEAELWSERKRDQAAVVFFGFVMLCVLGTGIAAIVGLIVSAVKAYTAPAVLLGAAVFVGVFLIGSSSLKRIR